MTDSVRAQRAARQRRREEIANARRSAESRQRNEDIRNGALLIGAVLAAALVLAGVIFLVSQLFAPPARMGERQPNFGAAHQPPQSFIEYPVWPPTSGTHYFQAAEPGIYDRPIAPGFWVHSLEHGYVVILYRCDTDCDQIRGQMQQLFEVVPKSRFGYPKLITMPDDRIESKFALLAWDWKLETDTFDQAKFIGFYRSHVDRGPENAG